MAMLCDDPIIDSDSQVSISPTFYEQLLCQNPFAKKLQTHIVSTFKAAQKTFVQKSCS
jgi:hypothetical protein